LTIPPKRCYNINVIKKEVATSKDKELIIMAKRKTIAKVVVDKNAAQFIRTAQNLAAKGKTNKKLHGRNANAKAVKYAI
jgi:hypothetical protein